MEFRRIPTGVKGLDELLEGGYPAGRVNLVAGKAGAGKTTFGMQFLIHGITDCKENGLFISIEEEQDDLLHDMSRFGWDLKKFQDEKKFYLLKPPAPLEVSQAMINVDDLLDAIHKKVTEIDAKRIVFDSVVALGLPYTDIMSLRRDILRLCALLRELGCTTLLLTEMPEEGGDITKFGIEQFVTQGVILLHYTRSHRGIEIRKMRGTKHNTNIHLMRLIDEGIIVNPHEHPF